MIAFYSDSRTFSIWTWQMICLTAVQTLAYIRLKNEPYRCYTDITKNETLKARKKHKSRQVIPKKNHHKVSGGMTCKAFKFRPKWTSSTFLMSLIIHCCYFISRALCHVDLLTAKSQYAEITAELEHLLTEFPAERTVCWRYSCTLYRDHMNYGRANDSLSYLRSYLPFYECHR